MPLSPVSHRIAVEAAAAVARSLAHVATMARARARAWRRVNGERARIAPHATNRLFQYFMTIDHYLLSRTNAKMCTNSFETQLPPLGGDRRYSEAIGAATQIVGRRVFFGHRYTNLFCTRIESSFRERRTPNAESLCQNRNAKSSTTIIARHDLHASYLENAERKHFVGAAALRENAIVERRRVVVGPEAESVAARSARYDRFLVLVGGGVRSTLKLRHKNALRPFFVDCNSSNALKRKLPTACRPQ